MVQIFLGREMSKEDGLADPGGGGDVLGLGAPETVARDAIDGTAQELAICFA